MGERRQWMRAVGALTCVLIGLGLHACGGGGGGGGGEAAGPSAPDGNVPLVLDAGNLVTVSPASLRAAESVLKLGQYAANEVARVARQGQLEFDASCQDGGGGSLRYSLQDRDGDRRPSAGDSIGITITRCYIDFLDETFNNSTLAIHLVSVDDAEHGALAGTLDFGAGVASIPQPDGFRVTWLGSLQFRRTSTLLREELSVSASPADDLRQSLRLPSSTGPVARAVAFQRPSMNRVLDRETARIQVTGSLRLASEALGGRVDIAFAPAWVSNLGSNADTGSVHITGAANARITVPAATGVASTSVQVVLDLNGDGVGDSTAAVSWRNALSGFFGSERSAATDAGSVGLHEPAFLRLLDVPTHHGAAGVGVDVTRPLRLQFDRPLSPDSAVFFKLFDTGMFYAQSYGVVNELSSGYRELAVQARRHGAAIVLEPQEPLRYGHGYQLRVSSVSDFSQAQQVLLRDASGIASMTLGVQLTGFEADGMLWAAVVGSGIRSVVMPGHPASISATVPFAISLPLRYRWAQLGGQPLVLGSPDAATTSVALADGSAPGVSRATLQLTVTDAVGRSSVDQFQMQVANLAGASTLLYFVSDPGDFIGGGQTGVYLPQTGSFTTDTTLGYITVRYDDRDPQVNWRLELAAPGGGVPTVGSYVGALDFATLDNSAPKMSFSGSGRACGGLPGSFQVLEIERDAAGRLLRLAVDFQRSCISNTPGQLRGALRINSSLPVQP
jgi:hypothetical protein